MVAKAELLYGSKFVMSLLLQRVIVPPYCGVPRLSHQFPVLVVVALTVTAVVVVDITGVEVVAEVTGVDVVVIADVIDVVVDVEEDVVDVAQDANTRDTTMRQVNTIQIALFFI
jgi:hypothetical protein